MSCSSRLRKLLLPLLKAVKEGKAPTFRMRSAASQAIFLVGKGIKKPSQGRLRRVFKRSTKNEETAKILAAVLKRSGNWCEACYPGRLYERVGGEKLDLDHWLSGSGRRTQKQSVATTWLLCRACHQARTANSPDAEWWNRKFAQHCAVHGYSFTPHVIHEPIARKAQ